MTTLAPSPSLPTAELGRGDWAINLEHVSKTYKGRFGRKGVHALRDITMRVRQGEVFGLLGPNGAGKSTLVKILMTIIRSSDCRGTMLGRPVGEKEVLARVGYLPEHHKFPDYLNGSQVLDFFGALSRVPREVRRKRSGELLELVGIEKWARTKVKSYSKGMRQRLGIANALMSDPELILLDEPTDGVDPVGRRDIRNVLMRLREQGKTVFLNSHLLSELEMVCDRVAILVQGVVSAQGTMDELTLSSRRYEIEIEADGDAPANERRLPDAVRGITVLTELPAATVPIAAAAPPLVAASSSPNGSLTMMGKLRGTEIPITVGRTSLTLGSDDPQLVQPIIDLLRQRGLTIKSVRPVRASLEDLFMLAVTDPTTGEVLKPGAADNSARKIRNARSGQ